MRDMCHSILWVHFITTVVVLFDILQIVCAESYRFDDEHLTEYGLFSARTLVHSPSLLDLRWFLDAAHPNALAAGAELPSFPQQLP